jgi:hypothetical protein
MKLAALWQVLRRERQWVALGAIYLMAWWLPLSLLWPLLHPGALKPEGIDGPVSWLWKNHWGVTHSPLSFQSLIPIGVVALLLGYRAEAAATLPRPGKKTPYLLMAGCVMLATSHLIHLPSLAIGALILIAVGIVTQIYGLQMLKALRVPFLFWLLMIPPPESLAGKALQLMGPLSVRGAGFSLKLIGKNVLVQPPQLSLNGISMEAGSVGTESSAGPAVLISVAVALLCWGLYRRWRLGRILMAVALGVFFGLVANILRIDIALLLRGATRVVSDFVLQANIWLLAIPSAALVLWCDTRAGKLAASGTGWLGKLLARGWEVSGKGADRVVDKSAGAVKGVATGFGRVVLLLISPFVFLLNLVVNGLGRFFKFYGDGVKNLDKRWRAADRARQKKKNKNRGSW